MFQVLATWTRILFRRTATCTKCGLTYCTGETCEQIRAEGRRIRQMIAAQQATKERADLLAPWAEFVNSLDEVR